MKELIICNDEACEGDKAVDLLNKQIESNKLAAQIFINILQNNYKHEAEMIFDIERFKSMGLGDEDPKVVKGGKRHLKLMH